MRFEAAKGAKLIIMNRVCFKLPTIEQVHFTITSEDEDTSPDDSIRAYETDEMVISGFIKGVRDNRRVSAFGWCYIKVTATYKGIEGSDGLGACSYRSLKDFIADGYYEQMRDAAYSELITNLQALAD